MELEGVGSRTQALGVDDGSNVGFALRGPHGAIAIGDLALNNGRSERALAGVVCGIDHAGP